VLESRVTVVGRKFVEYIVDRIELVHGTGMSAVQLLQGGWRGPKKSGKYTMKILKKNHKHKTSDVT
jgi:hypothetical protein